MAKKTNKTVAQQVAFCEDVVKDVKQDFLLRQQSRRNYELNWRLNLNFLMGNQYCSISPRGDVVQEDKFFFWQEKQVYNHIVPIVETRISRLLKNNARPTVRPFSNSDADVNSAQLSDKILATLHEKLRMDEVISRAVTWSESCGTSFYKVTWQNSLLGEMPTQDVEVTVCPPFEIYPDSNLCQGLEDVNSLIHARVFSVDDVKRIWGKDVVGESVETFGLNDVAGVCGLGYNSTVSSIVRECKDNHVLVIERYTRPSTTCPNGKLEIVAGNQLLHFGDLPYKVGSQGQRDFPFVRQVAFLQPGCFWGSSVIDRLIPVQRAYNALKNRKHEFLNRLTMGILMVEDGSVDTDNLEEEGLSPGKILVYRQGSKTPEIMDNGNVPVDFDKEESRLLDEFVAISGVSDFARNSTTPSNVTSGTALQLIGEQDEMRMSSTLNEISTAVKRVAKMFLQLYKQFAGENRLVRLIDGNNKAKLYYLSSSDVSEGDVVLDADNEISGSLATRRALLMELIASGLLTDKDGNINEQYKTKVLNLLGIGVWEQEKDTAP